MQKTVRASRSSGVRLSTGHLKTHASVRRHGAPISSTFSSTLSPDWTLLSSQWTFLLLDWTLTPRPPMTDTQTVQHDECLRQMSLPVETGRSDNLLFVVVPVSPSPLSAAASLSAATSPFVSTVFTL